VVKQIAGHLRHQDRADRGHEGEGDASRTDWVLVTRNQKLLDNEKIKEDITEITEIPGCGCGPMISIILCRY
jgi:hypothetical protein